MRYEFSGKLSSVHQACINPNLEFGRLGLTAGEAHDNRLADKLLSRLRSGTMLLADRGYDADWIRALAASLGRVLINAQMSGFSERMS